MSIKPVGRCSTCSRLLSRDEVLSALDLALNETPYTKGFRAGIKHREKEILQFLEEVAFAYVLEVCNVSESDIMDRAISDYQRRAVNDIIEAIKGGDK